VELGGLGVAQQGQKEEDGAEQFSSTHDSSHSLSVDGVEGEEESGDEAGSGADIQGGGEVEEEGHQGVEEEVGEVVAEGREAVEEIVQAIGEDAEGAVGFVRLLLGHGDTPEVVLENLKDGRFGSDVFVIFYGTDIIKHKSTHERVEVADQADNCQKYKIKFLHFDKFFKLSVDME